MSTPASHPRIRLVLRLLLGAFLAYAGTGHLTDLRPEFRSQVPAWFPADPDLVVVASGIVEITLGASLVLLPRKKVAIGLATAAFFIAIFPGNIAQWVEGRDAFGLDTDAKRLARLFFQPLLVVWALWSTGASATLRGRSDGD